MMNIFRSKNSEEFDNKIKSYESIVEELRNKIESQDQKINELVDKLQELSTNLVIKEEAIEEITEKVEEKEIEIAQLEEVIEQKEEIIQEVIENTVSVEKQASIKAMEIMAQAGTNLVETIDGPEEIDIISQMKNYKGQELVKFYNEHRELIKQKFKK